MAKRKSKKKTVKVEHHTHNDKRANIPTEELRDFVADDEKQPGMTLYPRDPSLDPQLVWRGKDEQDRTDLAVPTVPIYIQEKIHPQAIVENVRQNSPSPSRGEGRDVGQQLSLFETFDGLDWEQKIDFYQHAQQWTNRMILGDSLLVMNSLAEKEGLKGQVQMIYIDPPYGIKFGSNWQVSTRKRDVKDGKAADSTRQPEQVKAFRDTWELGIHSYLSYMRDRLTLARELLTESGSIFVQIGDENVHLVRSVIDEVFGSENFLGMPVFRKTSAKGASGLDSVSDFLLWYAKNKERVKYRQLFVERSNRTMQNVYNKVQLDTGKVRSLARDELEGRNPLPDGKRLMTSMLHSQSGGPTSQFAFEYQGRSFRPSGVFWKTSQDGLPRLSMADRLVLIGNTLMYKRFADDHPVVSITNLWDDTVQSTFAAPKVYVVQTANKVVERCVLMTTDPGDLVLDPTCGGGTTAYVAEQWGRRWITLDTSRVALSLARSRLMSARYPYYLLADSPEGINKEADLSGVAPAVPLPKTNGDLKRGFIYKRVPHIMLKTIANNEELDEIHARWQETLEPLRAQINKALDRSWEEWEIPRELDGDLNSAIRNPHFQWWEARLARQAEIDASIARNSESETLYDQPYTDNKRVRVSGPFTVESLSPHRVLAAEEGAINFAKPDTAESDFATMILDNLKKAGVQNTFKDERLKFETLEPFAGTYLHAAGEYLEGDKTRRVAVCIGPEHGTVDPDLIKEAAKEAVLGVGYDTLIVCGFAFDPHVSEEAKRYGDLTVLITRMNPDLTMGDELLKKTGAGNLFMIFGEPDIAIDAQEDDRLTVTIHGLDVYDPTTGAVRNSRGTDDIALWFIDTNYDGESFFVRHAYFTGEGDPYDKLKRALKAEIDPDAWANLYRTTSLPFDRPKTGRIAVKVINHYGDEVLKTYEMVN